MTRKIGQAVALALWLSATWATPCKAQSTGAGANGIEAFLQQIDAATGAGRFVQAEAMLVQLERDTSAPTSSKVALSRAEFHMAKGNDAEAAAALRQVGQYTESGESVCRYSRLSGWIAGNSGEWNTAILQLATAVDACGNDASLWNLLGLALIGKGEYSASLEAFDSALILQPEHPGLLNNRALAFASAGKYDSAMLDLNRAAAAAPGDASIRDNADYLSGVLDVAPERREVDSDTLWAARLARTGDGARDANRSGSATAYFANAALLSERFDAHIWAQVAAAQNRKAD